MTATQELIKTMLVLATLAPLVSSVINIFFGARLGNRSGWVATGLMGAGFVCSLVALFAWLGAGDGGPGTIVWQIPWIPLSGSEAGWLHLGLLADSVTIAMAVMVTLIAFLVHLYSVGYMAGDKRYSRFFAYLALFTFSMMGIVTANGLMQLFVFWELVGLTSYLLIGFWYEKRGPQAACMKAFIMNRVGDTGFLIGFGILFYQLGGRVMLPAATGLTGADGQPVLNMFEALTLPAAQGGLGIDLAHPPLWLTAAGIGLFFGAIGKSAQFPLHTWLPDAMEGPTPVSSIVHSATMVAAGVYLTARIYPILTPAAHLFVATIGLITLVMAACMALVMTDIKRVLAYSTLSQLGYMVLGLGVGSWAFALYHLITHAFFKCCLFQCSGSVIHAAHHQQDMRYYGGLGKKLPVTMVCYGICTLAIAGASIPFTVIGLSGFYSKDGIIAGAVEYGTALHAGGWGLGHLFWLGPMIIAFVTPFYMARSFALTFLGEPRDQHLYDHAHEAPRTMLIPQAVLAFMAVVSGWFLWKGLILGSEPAVETILRAEAIEAEHAHGMHLTHVWLLYGFAWILAIAAGLLLYIPGFRYSSKVVRVPVVRQLYLWTHNKFYFDALYDVFVVWCGRAAAGIATFVDTHFVDGIVNGCGFLGRAGAWLTGLFDLRVIDGLVNGAADMARTGGQLLRSTQAGRVRTYVMLLFASSVFIILIVATVAMATR